MPVTNYIWDVENDSYLAETDENNNTTVVYTNEPEHFGRVISQHRGNDTSYYHFDAIGSTRQLTNTAEVATDTYLYDSFGVPLSAAGTTVNNLRFVGELGYYFDSETGDSYVRGRPYGLRIARWLSRDPAGFFDGPHLYVYVHNQPTSAIDPKGTIKITKVKADLDGKCNKTVFIEWDFTLDKKHDCDGYIVQRIDYECDAILCDICKTCPNSVTDKPTYYFYEAWYVEQMSLVHIGQEGLGHTDRASMTPLKGTCGVKKVVGTIRFFCAETTGDLGKQGVFEKPKPKPPVKPKDPKSPWGPNKIRLIGNLGADI